MKTIALEMMLSVILDLWVKMAQDKYLIQQQQIFWGKNFNWSNWPLQIGFDASAFIFVKSAWRNKAHK